MLCVIVELQSASNIKNNLEGIFSAGFDYPKNGKSLPFFQKRERNIKF